MFRFLGRCASRGWPLILAAWVGIFFGLRYAAPSWQQVATQGQFNFPPEDAPTRRGEQIFDRAFPDEQSESSIVIVAHREGGEELRQEDLNFLSEPLVPELRQFARRTDGDRSEETDAEDTNSADDAGSFVTRIRSPGDEALRPLLVSDDRQAALVLVELTGGFLLDQTAAMVDRIEKLIERVQSEDRPSEGLQLALTGGAVIGRDHQRAVEDATQAVRTWTPWLMIGLLVLVYRAPIVATVPLAALYVSVDAAQNLLALLSQAGLFGLFDGFEVYVTVIVYGAGVDYSLFLISRQREELERQPSTDEAVVTSVSRVGQAIAASAGTEIFGIGMLAFADFGKFRQAGIAIALGLTVMLCASLTLVPALLRMTGRWAFRPNNPRRNQPNRDQDEDRDQHERQRSRFRRLLSPGDSAGFGARSVAC